MKSGVTPGLCAFEIRWLLDIPGMLVWRVTSSLENPKCLLHRPTNLRDTTLEGVDQEGVVGSLHFLGDVRVEIAQLEPEF